jgi:hypothetical protein
LAKKIDFTPVLAALATADGTLLAAVLAAAEGVLGTAEAAGLPEPAELPQAATATMLAARTVSRMDFRTNMSLLQCDHAGRHYLPSTR